MCGIEFAKLGEISVSNISLEFEAPGVHEPRWLSNLELPSGNMNVLQFYF